MTAPEISAFVPCLVVDGIALLSLTCSTDVDGTLKAESTDVMFTGVNTCLIAVIHRGAYDDSCCVPVKILDVYKKNSKFGVPLHNMGKPCRLIRDGIGITLPDA